MPAPDLLEAAGGNLSGIDQQLQGLARELAGLQGPPAPVTNTGMGAFANALGAFASPAAGIANPVQVQQQAASQFQRGKMQDQLGITKEQAQLSQAKIAIAREERLRDDALMNLAPTLLKAGGPAAGVGADIMTRVLGKHGFQAPPGFKEGLATQRATVKDIEDIQSLRLRGASLEDVVAVKPTLDPAFVGSLYGQAIPDDARKLMGLPTKAEEEAKLNKERRDAYTFARTVLEDQFPVGVRKETISKAQVLALQHHGKDWTALDQQTKATVLVDADKEVDKAKIDQATQKLISTGEHKPHYAPAGGYFYHKQTGQQEVALPEQQFLRESSQWTSLDKTAAQNRALAQRGVEQLRELQRLIPEILAKEPGANLAKYLKLKPQELTGVSPEIRRFTTLMTDAEIELARALSGAGQLRTTVMKWIQQRMGAGLMDTQATALEGVDQMMITLVNFERGLLGLPIMRNDQRVGPGSFEVIDLRTGKPTAITVPNGIITPPEFRVRRRIQP